MHVDIFQLKSERELVIVNFRLNFHQSVAYERKFFLSQ